MANNIDQPLVPVFDQLNTEEQFVEGLHRVVREVHAISNFSLRCILWTPRIVDEIIHALAGMTTLKEFQLHNVQANAIPSLVDVEVARIVEARSTHPTLEELDLGNCPLGRRSIHAIHQWMALDQCKLRDLSIDETFPDPLLLPLFVEGLPRNTSLNICILKDLWNATTPGSTRSTTSTWCSETYGSFQIYEAFALWA